MAMVLRPTKFLCPVGHRVVPGRYGWLHRKKFESETCPVAGSIEERELEGDGWPPDFDFFDRGMERRLPLEAD